MISYYGVKTHFENVIAEKHIRDTQEKRGNNSNNKKNTWPTSIKINLCPYVLWKINDLIITIPDKEDSTSPYRRFMVA